MILTASSVRFGEVAKLTVWALQDLANRYNVSFRVKTWDEKETGYWQKLDMIQGALRVSPWVLWLDCDVLADERFQIPDKCLYAFPRTTEAGGCVHWWAYACFYWRCPQSHSLIDLIRRQRPRIQDSLGDQRALNDVLESNPHFSDGLQALDTTGLFHPHGKTVSQKVEALKTARIAA